MKLKGIIFDLDGTLADTLPICVKASQDALLQTTGRQYTDAEITALFGPTEEGMLRKLVPDRVQEAMEIFLESYEREHYMCTAPFPSIREALEILTDQGVRLAIVTGKGPGSAEISLRHLGIRSLFDQVETGSPDGPIKPASIRKVLATWGIEPAVVAYVGDTPHDMRHSRRAGVLALGAAWAPTATVREADGGIADAVFESVEDFIRWVQEEED